MQWITWMSMISIFHISSGRTGDRCPAPNQSMTPAPTTSLRPGLNGLNGLTGLNGLGSRVSLGTNPYLALRALKKSKPCHAMPCHAVKSCNMTATTRNLLHWSVLPHQTQMIHGRTPELALSRTPENRKNTSLASGSLFPFG